MLRDKTVVLGVTGSIAAYKAVDLASKLAQAGAAVEVIMTQAATQFVTPLTFRSITRRSVITDLFDVTSQFSVEHVALAEQADVVVVAPATANIIAKLATGIADDMLTCTVLATQAPVILAPAMNVNMFNNQVTQDNLSRLRQRGFIIVGPAYGRLASGISGMGRLIEVEHTLGTISQVLGRDGDLAGKRLVVTAGGTREPVDPVRYIGNRSSGKMGYALAEAARDRGASVTLVSAATSVPNPAGVEVVPVETAKEMRDAVLAASSQADVLIMAAAVADFAPARLSMSKIKRKDRPTTLELAPTPDILGEIKVKLLRVGFAAESENLIANAQDKLKRKGLDLIVANDITAPDSGFGFDTNQVAIIDKQGNVEQLPLLLKTEVADRILDRVVELLAKKVGSP
ncbi:MAG: bifunctional phosphopantothenoylcysteine decarboxylase/phosphopantothenate--cysteine ligase CoaBC [Chloroflexi bacterium]|nr:bifunctional phosphopantothenoylcysteine decarboxylase/phosphopantothenate--cysteine ligase CoaBC [Chloroflexota bacterium]